MGSSITYTVVSNVTWKVNSNKNWVNIEPNSGKGNGDFTVTYIEYPSIEERTATITVVGKKISTELTYTAKYYINCDWYVTVDAADESGNVIEGLKDLFGLGRVHMITAPSNANEMIVSDLGQFWDFKVKVSYDQQDLTFQTNTSENNNLVADYEDINVTITGGKILPKAGRQNNGSPADSIVFYVSFSDDEYPAAYGYAKYKVSGILFSNVP